MSQITKLEFDLVAGRANAAREAHRLATASAGLLWEVLDQFFPTLNDDKLELVTDGPDDRGVDALHVIESDEMAKVFIFQAKFRDRHDNTNHQRRRGTQDLSFLEGTIRQLG